MSQLIGGCLALIWLLNPAYTSEIVWKTEYEHPSQGSQDFYAPLLARLPKSRVIKPEHAQLLLKSLSLQLGTPKKRENKPKGIFLEYLKRSLNWNQVLHHTNSKGPEIQIFDEYYLDGLVYRQLMVSDTLVGSFRVLMILPGPASEPFPAIMGLHGHGGSPESFSEELLGHQLAKKGFLVFLPRFRAMEFEYERKVSKELFLRGYHLMAIRAYEAYLGANILQSLPFVDPQKIGLLGHSGGSAVAHILIRLTDIFKACVSDYDSSYYFSWDEFCCEAVPGLAVVSGQLNDTDDFACKALKAPYHFSPREDDVINFFEEALKPVSKSFKDLHSELSTKTDSFLIKSMSRFMQLTKTNTTIAWKNAPENDPIKEVLASVEYPSIAEPYLMKIIGWEVFSQQLKQSYRSATLLKLPINRLRALSLILPAASRNSPAWQQRVFEDIKTELGKIHDPQLLYNALGQFDLVNTASSASILLLKAISTTGTIFTTFDFSYPEKIQTWAKHIYNQGFSETAMQYLGEEESVFQLDCLLEGADKIYDPTHRDLLFALIINVYLKTSQKLDSYDLLRIQLRVARSFPIRKHLIPFETPAKISSLTQEVAVEKKTLLAQEALHENRFDLIDRVLEACKTGERSEVLYKLTIYSLENKLHQGRCMNLFSSEINSWKEPSSRAGAREEILREGGLEAVGDNFLPWLHLIQKDIGAIESNYDRRKHAQRMYELASELGFEVEANAFLNGTPIKYELQTSKTQIKNKQGNEAAPQEIKSAIKVQLESLDTLKATLKTDFEQSLKIFQESLLIQKLTAFPLIMREIELEPTLKRAHFYLDFAHSLIEQGNQFEATRIGKSIYNLLLKHDLSNFEKIIPETLKCLNKLSLYEEYRSILLKYLRTVALISDSHTANQKWTKLITSLGPNALVPADLLQKINFKDLD